jgi:predicted small secreted protein
MSRAGFETAVEIFRALVRVATLVSACNYTRKIENNS